MSRIHSTKQTESTGERDQKKLNQIYYEGARSHFIIQMNAHWRAVLKICPELADIKELEFDAEEVFFTCFYDSSPIDGIQQPIQHWEQTILDLLNSKRPKLEKNKAMRLWGGLLSQKEDIMKDHIDKLTEDGIRYLAQWIQTECNRVSQRFAHDYSPSKVPKLKKAQTE
ncbi:hypothetical protein [Vibrio gigantis]|uniref:hypothetical protein n=1 Tax=Vibrio gigantis TaxID=296199 RepID=UPI0035A6EE4B